MLGILLVMNTRPLMKMYQSEVLDHILCIVQSKEIGYSEKRSRIHERIISLGFLGIVLKVLRLEVSVWISQTIGKGVWFSIRFSSCLLYSVQ